MTSWSDAPDRASVFLDVSVDALGEVDPGSVFEVAGGPMRAAVYVAGLPGSAAFADDVIARVAATGVARIARLVLVAGRVLDGDAGPFAGGHHLGDVPWSPHHLRRNQHAATARLLARAAEEHVVRITAVGDREGTVAALRQHHLPYPGVADLLETLPVDLTKGDFPAADRLARILATHRTASTVIGPSVPPSVPAQIEAITAGMEATLLGGGTPLAEVLDGALDGVWAPPELAARLERAAPAGLVPLLRSIAADPAEAGQAIRGVHSVRFLVADGLEVVFDRRPYVLLVREA